MPIEVRVFIDPDGSVTFLGLPTDFVEIALELE